MELPDLTVLKEQFKDEPLYLDVLDAITGFCSREVTLCEKKRAQHRKTQYVLNEGKLWFIGGGSGTRAQARRECVSKVEVVELARAEHEQGRHWHRDAIKMALLDWYHSPKLDESIVKAVLDCAHCKNFGGMHLHSLLQPITRCHPFELLVGNYLSLPVGKGGYHTARIYLDMCSQHVWGYKFKTHGTAILFTPPLIPAGIRWNPGIPSESVRIQEFWQNGQDSGWIPIHSAGIQKKNYTTQNRSIIYKRNYHKRNK